MARIWAYSTASFGEHRDLLVGVAYRVLGSVADAEDVVQEAWLRWDRTDPRRSSTSAPSSCVMTTRLAIDRLRRLKARRETYVGPWLPEPVLTERDVAEEVELAESVSLALLVVLETFSPLERAVFVLREAFGTPMPRSARSSAATEAVRQLARRARDHVRDRDARFDADQADAPQVTEQFLAAVQQRRSEGADGGARSRRDAVRRQRRTRARAAASGPGGGQGCPFPGRRRDPAGPGRAGPHRAGERRARHSGHLGRGAGRGVRPRRGRWGGAVRSPGGEPREAGRRPRARYALRAGHPLSSCHV